MVRIILISFVVVVLVCLVDGRRKSADEAIAEAGDLENGRNRNGQARGHKKQSEVHDNRNPRSTHLTELDIMQIEPEQEEMGVVYVDDDESKGKGKGNGNRGNGNGNSKRSSQWPAKRGLTKADSRSRRSKRNAIDYDGYYRWTDGQIPYTIAGSYTDAELATIQEAMDEFSTYTCVRWVERSDEKYYVNIQTADSGCWSYVGKVPENYQPQGLNLVTSSTSSSGGTCVSDKSTPVHEMMHASGVYHQHTRQDRDNYVTINYNNINSNYSGNFDIPESGVTTYDTIYSYKSVMHYGSTYFSTNGQDTIETADSSYSDVIGTAPTFSYEDIQLLNQMYSCSASCTEELNCPTDSYVGPDCKCYCASGDDEVPVYDCTYVCWKPDVDCQCAGATDACADVANSACNSASGACECSDGFTSHDNVCVVTSSITCDALNTDCKCSLNDGSCESLSNSECDSGTDSCVCSANFNEENGACTDIYSTACDEADKACHCSEKGDDACSSVANSACDSEGGACVCSEDFYTSGDMCIATPACTTVGAGCYCSKQGSDACASLDNTLCNSETDACECDTSAYKEEGGVCVDAYSYTSDGSTVYPFVESSVSTTYFYSVEDSDVTAFDVASNGYYLEASGTGSGKAAIETGLIDYAGTWCLKFAVRLNNARVRSMYSGDGSSFYSYSLYTPGKMNYFYSRSLTVTTPSKIQFRVQAEPYDSSAAWDVAIDPVKAYLC